MSFLLIATCQNQVETTSESKSSQNQLQQAVEKKKGRRVRAGGKGIRCPAGTRTSPFPTSQMLRGSSPEYRVITGTIGNPVGRVQASIPASELGGSQDPVGMAERVRLVYQWSLSQLQMMGGRPTATTLVKHQICIKIMRYYTPIRRGHQEVPPSYRCKQLTPMELKPASHI